MHPGDAQRRGLVAGELVQIASKRGALVLPLELSDELRSGTVFAPMHWSGQSLSSGGINEVSTPAVDARSQQPELKHTAVRVEKTTFGWHLLAARRGGCNRLAADVAATVARLRLCFAAPACRAIGRQQAACIRGLGRAACRLRTRARCHVDGSPGRRLASAGRRGCAGVSRPAPRADAPRWLAHARRASPYRRRAAHCRATQRRQKSIVAGHRIGWQAVAWCAAVGVRAYPQRSWRSDRVHLHACLGLRDSRRHRRGRRPCATQATPGLWHRVRLVRAHPEDSLPSLWASRIRAWTACIGNGPGLVSTSASGTRLHTTARSFAGCIDVAR